MLILSVSTVLTSAIPLFSLLLQVALARLSPIAAVRFFDFVLVIANGEGAMFLDFLRKDTPLHPASYVIK